jgi:hypothetical protein
MKMYQALSGAAAQKAVLRAVAKDRLPADMLLELEAILDEFKKVAKLRNAVIHGQWEISDDHPDELVWYDSGAFLLSHSEFWAGYRAHDDKTERMQWMGTFTGRPTKYLLYSEGDFEEILERIRTLFFRLMDFVLATEKIHQPESDKASL